MSVKIELLGVTNNKSRKIYLSRVPCVDEYIAQDDSESVLRVMTVIHCDGGDSEVSARCWVVSVSKEDTWLLARLAKDQVR